MKKMWKRILAFMLVVGMMATMTDYSSLMVVQAAVNEDGSHTYTSGSGEPTGDIGLESGSSIAAVYTADTGAGYSRQLLNKIAFHASAVGITYSYQIYKETSTANPESGTAVYRAEKTGVTDRAGLIEITLDNTNLTEPNALLLSNGEVFSVVIKVESANGYVYVKGYSSGNKNSYCKESGTWDAFGYYRNSDYEVGDADIRAYTTNDDPSNVYPITNITLDKESQELLVGTVENPSTSNSVQLNVTAITPNYASDKSVVWETVDSNVIDITPAEDGMSATITAKKAGHTTINVKPKNATSSSPIATCAITVKNDIACMLSVPESVEFSGAELTPAEVKNGSTALSLYNEGTKAGDYTVTYSDNINVGTASVTVKGYNNYGGEATKTFRITQKDISSFSYRSIGTMIANGTALQPEVVLLDGTREIPQTDTATGLANFSVNYENNSKPGTATFTVTGENNYTGTVSGSFGIGTSIAANEITASAKAANYTGKEVVPTLTVTLSLSDGTKKTLTLGTDYKIIRCENNIAVGTKTASVLIEGIGEYDGQRTVPFTILARSMESSDITIEAIDNQVYTGNPVTPKVVVRDGDTILQEYNEATGSGDYTLSYADNTIKTTEGQTEKLPTVTVTGTGNYRNTKSATFQIKGSIADASITVSSDGMIYDGTEQKPTDIAVEMNGTPLTNGKDYTVSYENNINAGNDAKVIITGKGEYAGTASKNFNIKQRSLRETAIRVATVSDQIYVGTALQPEVSVYDTLPDQSEAQLATTNYTIKYVNTTNAAQKDDITSPPTVEITGQGNYTDTIKTTFTILPKSIKSVTLEWKKTPPTFTYNGTQQVIKAADYLDVYDGAKQVLVGDYVNVYSDAVNAGTVVLTIKGQGNYTGESDASLRYTILPKSIQGCDVSAIPEQTYNGKEQCPVPLVNDGIISRALFAGKEGEEWVDIDGVRIKPDFYVTYSNNTKVTTESSKAIATIHGMNNYTGTIEPSSQFDIQYKIDADLIQVAAQEYTGGAVTPAVTVKYNEESGERVLTAGTDYSIRYGNNVNACESTDANAAYVEITGLGAYKGTIKKTFNISKKVIGNSGIAASDITVQNVDDQTYTGSAVEPDPTVTWNKTDGSSIKLSKNDYTISYKGYTADKHVDVADSPITFTITGKGNYEGTITKTFHIVEKDISLSDVTIETIPTKQYTGSDIEPEVTLTYQGKKLVAGTASDLLGDYVVTYSNNKEMSTAENPALVIIKGRNNFKGTRTESFLITKSMNDSTITLTADGYKYTGNPIKPSLQVVNGGNTLNEGTDYEIVDENNTNASDKATVVVKGKNGYTGEKQVSFQINQKSVADADVILQVADVEYSGVESNITPSVTVTYNGKTLEATKDYTITYNNCTGVKPSNATKPTVTITGVNNFTGTKTSDPIEIKKKNLADTASVKVYSGIGPGVAALDYTGTTITHATAALSITVTCAGVNLTEGKDYTLEYSNTDKIGMATLTVKAKEGSDYTGEQQIPFYIVGNLESEGMLQVTGLETEYKYTGQEIKIDDLEISCKKPMTDSSGNVIATGSKLVENRDYKISYENNVQIGTASIKIVGQGAFKGTVTKNFTIKGNISDATITPLTIQAYTGSAVTPEPVVKIGDTKLIPVTDYTVTYENNTNVGTARIKITGAGNYASSDGKTIAATFEIKYNMNSSLVTAALADPSATYTYDGTEKKPAITLTTSVGSEQQPTLYNDSTKHGDYTVVYENAINATTDDSKASVVIEAIKDADGNYTGKYYGKCILEYAIAQQQIGSNYEAKDLSKTYVAYKGGASFPQTVPVLRKQGASAALPKELVQGTDYTVMYSNHTAITTDGNLAKATITGCGNYTGTLETYYQIVEKAINDEETIQVSDMPRMIYNGEAQTPEFTLTYYAYDHPEDPVELRLGTDYTVSYDNNINAGEQAQIKVVGQNGFKGERDIYFTIEQKDLNDLNVKYNDNVALANVVYKAAEYRPEIAVKYQTPIGSELTLEEYKIVDPEHDLMAGDYYKPTYENNINAGTASVVIEAVKDESGNYSGNYKGIKTLNFKIEKRPLDNEKIVPDVITDKAYTGEAVTVQDGLADGTKWNVKLNGISLKYDPETNTGDYILSYNNNIKAGNQAEVTIEATADGNLSGSVTKTFTIGTDISTTEIVDPTTSVVYNGMEQEPVYTLKKGGQLIDENDYTVDYVNNQNAGQATVTITGKNACFGTRTEYFEIEKKDLCELITDATVSQTQEYTGSALNPQVKLSLENGIELVEETDFSVTYSGERTAVGEQGTVVIHAIEDGNYYESEPIELAFEVVPKSVNSEEVIVSAVSDTAYIGQKIEPAVASISYLGNELTAGEDYTIEYGENTNAGMGYIYIKGMGNFTDIKTIEFKIIADLSKAKVSLNTNQMYTGTNIEPELSVECGGNKLVLGNDYIAAYDRNIDPGTATITITPATVDGYYSGRAIVPFNIAYDIEQIKVNSVASAYTYTGSDIRPTITATSNYAGNAGETLSQGTDYTVTYRNNLNAGTGSAVLTGHGKYAGTKVYSYSILRKNINNCTFSSVADQTYDGAEKTPGVTVKAGSKTLVPGSDYAISYRANRTPGIATITISGVGNYTGTKYIYFNISTAKTYKVKVSKTATKSVTLTWSKVAGATGYEVYTADSSKRIAKVSKNKATVKSLKAATTYQYKVRAYITTNGVKRYGAFSSVLTFSTQPVKVTMAVNSPAQDQARVRWTTVKCTGYEVYRATSKKGKYKKVKTISKSSTRSYTDKNVVTGMNCYYKVRTYCVVNGKKVYGSFSKVKSVKIK